MIFYETKITKNQGFLMNTHKVGHHNRHKERGIAIWYILVGIILFAAVSFSFMRGVGTSSGSANKEQVKIQTDQLIRYAKSLEQAVTKLRLNNGCGENDISFYSTKWATPADYDNTNTPVADADFNCHVFNQNGGGQNWRELNKLLLEGENDNIYITTDFAIQDVGTAEPELLFMERVSADECAKINAIAKIGGDYDAGAVVATYTNPFNGGYAIVDTIGDAAAHADLAGKNYGCLIDGNDDFIFFNVLIDR